LPLIAKPLMRDSALLPEMLDDLLHLRSLPRVRRIV